MNVIESYCLLIGCGLVAYVLTLLFIYFDRCFEKWINKNKIKRQFNNDLFRQRCKFVHKNIKDYYYTLAVNNPLLLATEIADAHTSCLTRKQMIMPLYTRLKTANKY